MPSLSTSAFVLPSAAEQIRVNRLALDRILDDAREFLSAGRLDECAATLQVAGFHAWRNHPGAYFSSRLENLAVELSGSVERRCTCRTSAGVLHVLTEASRVGGHTRLAWRWIDNDTSSRHSVVLTSQRGAAIPGELESAVARSGGTFIDLSATHRGLISRAGCLAALADAADMVIVHAHPHDVVPLLALTGTSTPVAFVNHADHVFWTGGSAADLVVNLRHSGSRLSIDHREVQPRDSVVLPLPLMAPRTRETAESSSDSGEAFRAASDVPQSAPLAVTIASPYKFNSSGDLHYLLLHEELLHRHPDLHIRVAGPSRDGAWREAERRTAGRIRAVGPVSDLESLYAAADLYLDSFPMGSLTSLLDASARGIPVISFSAISTPHVMTSDDPSLIDFPVYFSDRDAYLDRADDLIGDREHRTSQGAEMAREVARLHTTEWVVALERTYATLRDRAAGRRSVRQLEAPAADGTALSPVQELLVDVHNGSGMSMPVWRVRMLQAPHVPMRTRLGWLRSTPGRAWPSVVPYLVSDVHMARSRPPLRRLRTRLAAATARLRAER